MRAIFSNAIFSAAVSKRIAAPASAGDRVAAAGAGPVVEKSIVETVVISIARAGLEIGQVRTDIGFPWMRVRFRAASLHRTKKLIQFHPLGPSAVNARRRGG